MKRALTFLGGLWRHHRTSGAAAVILMTKDRWQMTTQEKTVWHWAWSIFARKPTIGLLRFWEMTALCDCPSTLVKRCYVCEHQLYSLTASLLFYFFSFMLHQCRIARQLNPGQHHLMSFSFACSVFWSRRVLSWMTNSSFFSTSLSLH